MALLFPPSPLLGERYPVNPGTAGVSQYSWDGVKWVTVPTTVSLGTTNQDAYNAYEWPLTDGTAGKQLTTDGAGNLSWDVTASTSLQVLSLLEPFDGVQQAFTLIEFGGGPVFTPTPSTNIIVFLGGVPQLPVASFTVSGATITFGEAPLAGSTFYAISSIVV